MALRIDASGEAARRTANLPALSAFTLAGWCYRYSNRSGQFQFITGIEDASSNANGWLLFGWDNENSLAISTNDGYTTVASPANTTWFYWFLRSNGTNSYQAGWKTTGAWTTVTLTATLTWTPAVVWVGNDSYDEWLDSASERVRCWDAALTNTELDSELASATPVRTSNLRANWPLVSDANDTTANGYNLTTVGSVSYVSGPTFSDTSVVIPALLRRQRALQIDSWR